MSDSWKPRDTRPNRNIPPPSWLKNTSQQPVEENEDNRVLSILFVCTGNVCRSAFAACALNQLTRGKKLQANSAGIGALVGHPIDTVVASIANELGIATDGHLAKQLTGRILNEADLAVTFGREHHEWILHNYPEHFCKAVPIGKLITGVQRILYKTRPDWSDLVGYSIGGDSPSLADYWIPDPYKQPDDVYRDVTFRIWTIVTGIESLLRADKFRFIK